jgi:hypothetical protein
MKSMQIPPEQRNRLIFNTNNDKKLTAFEFALCGFIEVFAAALGTMSTTDRTYFPLITERSQSH